MHRREATNTLLLEDFEKMSLEEARDKIFEAFEVARDEIDKFQILIAYMSVGRYGSDSSAWLLLRRCEDGALYEVHGSHCSCYGFEGQFGPEATTKEYLKSDKFSFSHGGYDRNEAGNSAAVRAYLQDL